MSIKIFLVVMMAIFSCSQRSGVARSLAMDQEFDLKIGQELSVPDADLTISFDSVAEDSRCPLGVSCIWSGNAAVIVKLRKAKGDSSTVKLNTDVEPKEYAIGAYKLILVRLTPYPKQDVSIKKKDYVAVFVVRKAS